MTFVTTEELRNLLISDGILEGTGISYFEFLNVKTQGNNKSSIGYLIQDWLSDWMKSKNIYHRSPENTQIPPDFYLSEDDTKNLLEVKAFDYEAGPNFDIANYEAYCRALLKEPCKVDSDYLIFGYTLTDGVFKIKELWIKKVWEITRKMEDFPINVQKKQGIIYNIRPAKWYSSSCSYPIFGTKEVFLQALQDSLFAYDVTAVKTAPGWLEKFNDAYSKWAESNI